MSVQSEIDRINGEISNQETLIDEILAILDNKAVTNPKLQEKTVTPSAVQQEVKPDAEYDGLSKVLVNGDANLVPENIKEGVSIFGVLGLLSSLDIMFRETVTETYTVNPGGPMDTNDYDEKISLKSLPYLPFIIIALQGEDINTLPGKMPNNGCAIYVRHNGYWEHYTGVFNDEKDGTLADNGFFTYTKKSDGTYDLDGIRVWSPYMPSAGNYGGDKYTAILIGKAVE